MPPFDSVIFAANPLYMSTYPDFVHGRRWDVLVNYSIEIGDIYLRDRDTRFWAYVGEWLGPFRELQDAKAAVLMSVPNERLP